MNDPRSRAVVFSGGGPAGEAWMLGLIAGLRDEGVDLGQADLVVGTSAGARVGAQLAAGSVDAGIETIRGANATQLEFPVALDSFIAAAAQIMAEERDAREASRRIANLEPLGEWLVPAADRREVIAAALEVSTWPETPLAITAVDAQTGRRVAFDAESGVGLLDALTASGSLPGVVELLSIDGRSYADGGVHSLYNADLAAGKEVVVVISPLPLNALFQARLDREVAALGDAAVHVVVPSEASLAAIGPDPLSAQAARAALDAGRAQSGAEAPAVASAWA